MQVSSLSGSLLLLRLSEISKKCNAAKRNAARNSKKESVAKNVLAD